MPSDRPVYRRPADVDGAPAIDALREQLVAALKQGDHIRFAPVEQAFRAVPREQFPPGVDLETVYTRRQIVTNRGPNGAGLSSASSPNLVADMLGQLDPHSEKHVLEIGAATGINAALLAETTRSGGKSSPSNSTGTSPTAPAPASISPATTRLRLRGHRSRRTVVPPSRAPLPEPRPLNGHTARFALEAVFNLASPAHSRHRGELLSHVPSIVAPLPLLPH
ncbi:hypothetical protein [Micromonospora trifolii]|uniref:hypothetical protein n=1 Tax=Micromonospora trifolii TaxID=2911208 RepID=UPI003CEC284C